MAPKVFDVLVVLVEHSGRLITKDELLNAVWGENHVEEGSLTFSISMLRKSLGETKAQPKYVETVPRRGYRFVGEVKQLIEDNVAAAEGHNVSQLSKDVEAPSPSEGEDEKQAPGLDPATGAEVIVPRRTTRQRVFAIALSVVAIFVVVVYDLVELPGHRSSVVTSKMGVVKHTHTGQSVTAAISPDGKYIARVAKEAGQQSLWIEQTAASGATQIIAPAMIKYIGLTFSADGGHLYYVSWQAWEANAPPSLYLIPTLGGKAKKILAEVHSPVTLSPDGTRLAFVRNNKRLGESAVIVANADGTAERKLAIRRRPDNYKWVAWSPDGQTIACSVLGVDGGLHTSVVAVSVQSGTERSLSRQKWDLCGQLQWLGDGSGLIVAATPEASQPPQIWHLAYPGGEARKITNDVNSYEGVSLTRDARTLVTLQADQLTNIWVTPPHAALGTAAQITFGKSDGVHGVAWTPDGRIVYGSLASGKSDIWVMNADGTGARQLTSGAGNNVVPAVSPDGRYVVFASDRTGTYHIWKMDSDGGNELPLTAGRFDQAPCFSPDGRWVYYGSWQTSKPTLWKVPLEGGGAQQLTEEYSLSPVVSADGKLIAYFHADNERDIQLKTVVTALDGKAFRREFEILSPQVRWTPGQRALSFVLDQDGTSNIGNQLLGGGPPRQLTDFKLGQILHFDWSRDGQRLAYARTVVFKDVVMISDFK